MSGIIQMNIYEFSFPGQEFSIIFEDNIWRAKCWDEEKDEDIIIEDPQKGIKLEDEIELFEGFIFSKDKLDKYKQTIGV